MMKDIEGYRRILKDIEGWRFLGLKDDEGY